MNALRELDPQRTVAHRAGARPRLESPLDPATREVPGKPAGAARVREADAARQVYELWHTAGVLPVGAAAPCGRVTPTGSSERGVEDGDARHG